MLRVTDLRRPNLNTLPEWRLPFYPRSAGMTTIHPDSPEVNFWEYKPFVQINWVIGGNGTMLLRGEIEEVETGDVILQYPGEARENRTRGSHPFQIRWLTFDGPEAAGFARSYGYPQLTRGVGECPEQIFREYELGLSLNLPESMRRNITLIADLLARIGGTHQDGSASGALIQAFLTLVREKYSDPNVDLNAICTMLDIHRSTLSRIFRERMQMSPGRYLRQFRLQQAFVMLNKTCTPISEVGFRCGIADPANFARLIRETCGLSPKEFREQNS